MILAITITFINAIGIVQTFDLQMFGRTFCLKENTFSIQRVCEPVSMPAFVLDKQFAK